MKKLLIIYVFVAGLLSLALAGYAAPAFKNQAVSKTALQPQKGFFVGTKGDHSQKDKYIVLNVRVRTALSITVFPALRESSTVVDCYRATGTRLPVVEPEKLFFDHLLHLFPSHYFW